MTQDNTEDTLFKIDKKFDEFLSNDLYDSAVVSMAIQERYSICKSFSECHFWQRLSPQLKQRLFREVLGNII